MAHKSHACKRITSTPSNNWYSAACLEPCYLWRTVIKHSKSHKGSNQGEITKARHRLTYELLQVIWQVVWKWPYIWRLTWQTRHISLHCKWRNIINHQHIIPTQFLLKAISQCHITVIGITCNFAVCKFKEISTLDAYNTYIHTKLFPTIIRTVQCQVDRLSHIRHLMAAILEWNWWPL